MQVALMIVLIAFSVQGLFKFCVGFPVPYRTRIRRIASYYERGGRIIGVYDTLTLLIIVAMIGLLAATEMQYISFFTGLIVGMLIIQIFFHRFRVPLPAEKSPETPIEPRKLMSYAIQANPALGWREVALMAVLFVWALYEMVRQLLG